MADRYWVGGSATWDSTAGTKWATTSGGAGGASVPGSNDDVFLDANSGAVTITLSSPPQINALDTNGFTGSVAGGSNTLVIQCGTLPGSGNILRLASGATYTSFALQVINLSGGTGTVNYGGATVSSSFGTWVLSAGAGSTINVTNNLTVTGSATLNILRDGRTGTVNLGSATLDVTLISMCGSGTVALGTSTLVSSGYIETNSGGTLTTGASTQRLRDSAGFYVNAGGRTFGTLDCINSAAGTPRTRLIILSGSGVTTFANITQTTASNTNEEIAVRASTGTSITVTGTLTLTGTGTGRSAISAGSGSTLAAIPISAAAVSLTRADFRGITASGAASPFSGSSIGDDGNNTNITATAAVTRHLVATGAWESTSCWSTSSGGSSGASAPLPQDTVISDQGAFTITAPDRNSVSACRVFTFSGSSTGGISGFIRVGDTFTAKSGISVSNVYFSRLSSSGTFTSAGLTYNQVGIACPGTTITLQDTLTVGAWLGIGGGTFVTNNNTVNVTSQWSANNNSPTPAAVFSLGSSTINVTGVSGYAILFNEGALNLSAGTSTINVNPNSTSLCRLGFYGATLNNIAITGSVLNSDVLFEGFSGAATVNGTFSSSKTVAHTIRVSNSATLTVANWTVTGTAGNVVTVTSNSASSQHFLTKTGGGNVSVDYLNLSWSNASPGSAWYAGLNSTNSGNNSGWIFNVPGAVTSNTFLFGSNF